MLLLCSFLHFANQLPLSFRALRVRYASFCRDEALAYTTPKCLGNPVISFTILAGPYPAIGKLVFYAPDKVRVALDDLLCLAAATHQHTVLTDQYDDH
jgi:hypothetical protein